MRPKIPLVLMGSLLLVAAAILIWPNISAFFASDGCLDSGGSYDYLAGRCDYHRNHPFLPFYRTWNFWLSAIAVVLGSIVFGRAYDTREAKQFIQADPRQGRLRP
jgi:hypothetical protein